MSIGSQWLSLWPGWGLDVLHKSTLWSDNLKRHEFVSQCIFGIWKPVPSDLVLDQPVVESQGEWVSMYTMKDLICRFANQSFPSSSPASWVVSSTCRSGFVNKLTWVIMRRVRQNQYTLCGGNTVRVIMFLKYLWRTQLCCSGHTSYDTMLLVFPGPKSYSRTFLFIRRFYESHPRLFVKKSVDSTDREFKYRAPVMQCIFCLLICCSIVFSGRAWLI